VLAGLALRVVQSITAVELHRTIREQRCWLPSEAVPRRSRQPSAGTISRENQLRPGVLIILGGRKWSVSDVDERSHTLLVMPAS